MEYVVVSSTVYDRVLAAAEQYPALVAFYRRSGRGDRAGAGVPAWGTATGHLSSWYRDQPLRRLRSPQASSAAASISPSTICVRPGRTIEVGDEPWQDRQPEVDDAVHEDDCDRHRRRDAEADEQGDQDAPRPRPGPPAWALECRSSRPPRRPRAGAQADGVTERGEGAPQAEHVEEPEPAGEEQGGAERPVM